MAAPTTDEPYILKFLSGPHLGAEVTLTPGEYLIGRGDQCDIVLDDQDLAPVHARLALSAAGAADSRFFSCSFSPRSPTSMRASK